MSSLLAMSFWPVQLHVLRMSAGRLQQVSGFGVDGYRQTRIFHVSRSCIILQHFIRRGHDFKYLLISGHGVASAFAEGFWVTLHVLVPCWCKLLVEHLRRGIRAGRRM